MKFTVEISLRISYNNLAMRECWNRQTGTFEGRVSHGVRVQVPSLAPFLKVNHLTRMIFLLS